MKESGNKLGRVIRGIARAPITLANEVRQDFAPRKKDSLDEAVTTILKKTDARIKEQENRAKNRA